jgi:acyl carrier protein
VKIDNARTVIGSFISETFKTDTSEVEVNDNTSFIDAGLVDSMRVLELVDFLESRFRITVLDSELVPENLDSISNICRYLETKGIPLSDL